jgi:hypothetical protein
MHGGAVESEKAKGKSGVSAQINIPAKAGHFSL